MLRGILAQMTGIEAVESLSDTQVEALGGSETLKAEVSTLHTHRESRDHMFLQPYYCWPHV